ncbi:MAG: DUF6134 family protein [Pirellulales bacterium]
MPRTLTQSCLTHAESLTSDFSIPSGAAAVIIALIMAVGVAPARSAHAQNVLSEEIREFEILVKDKPAGKSSMRISDLDDGTTRVTTDVHVKLNYVVFVYRYDFAGYETWRGNRLLSTANRATDDGKIYEARAESDTRGFRIEANGRSQTAALIDMTTNYWRPPELEQHPSLALMNADRGIVQTARVERLAPEPLNFGAQQITCSHYRFSGDVQAELWFDGQNRIVRQKGIEEGYPTELRLTRLTRPVPAMASRPRPQQPLR